MGLLKRKSFTESNGKAVKFKETFFFFLKQDSGNAYLDTYFSSGSVSFFFFNVCNTRDFQVRMDFLDQKEKREILYT